MYIDSLKLFSISQVPSIKKLINFSFQLKIYIYSESELRSFQNEL